MRTKTKKPAKEYFCGTCGMPFPFSIALENHMSREHGVPFRYKCDQQDCNFGVNVRSAFSEHLFQAHNVNVGENPVLQCSFCEYRTTLKQVFLKHQLNHTAQEYSIKCTHEGCDKVFRQVRHLTKHQNTVHVDLKLKCQYCDSVFPTKPKMRRHEHDMHTGRERNFKCAYCSL